jgi:hypothetical protein
MVNFKLAEYFKPVILAWLFLLLLCLDKGISAETITKKLFGSRLFMTTFQSIGRKEISP